MKIWIPLSALLLTTAAQASHPHDSVCVGTATIEGKEPVQFLFQWEIERQYKQGSPSADSHQLTVEARTCFTDYDTESCAVAKDSRTVPPGNQSGPVPIQLKDAKGRIFFDGTFRFGPQEKLLGQLDPQFAVKSEKPALKNAPITLTCMPQPRVNLTPAK